ncbi:MAG: hypothetical protein ABIP55_05315 [Tepidisphaeraceae bacterium]
MSDGSDSTKPPPRRPPGGGYVPPALVGAPADSTTTQPTACPAHHPDARLSLTAIIGALWAPLFFVMLLLSTVQVSVRVSGDQSEPLWRPLLNFTLLPLGVAAPFATTVLGLLALGRIQRSGGHLYGLSLALFDALIFPLLLMDMLVFWFFWSMDQMVVNQEVLSSRVSGLLIRQALPTIVCVLGDYFLVTRAWAAVQVEDRPNATSQARKG